jgi:hypothetical protein
MKNGIICGVILCLSGCAGMQQAVQTYGSVAVTNARAANDTMIEGYKVGVCALPFSTVMRHPEIIPAIEALCLPRGDRIGAELLRTVEQNAGRAQ